MTRRSEDFNETCPTNATFIELYLHYFYKYPNWYCRIEPINLRVERLLQVLFVCSMILICFVLPTIYEPSNVQMPVVLGPDWLVSLVQFSWDTFPSTRSHTYFVEPEMKRYLPAIHTIILLFFIPSVICLGLKLDLRKRKLVLKPDGRVKRFFHNGIVLFFFLVPLQFILAIVAIFFFGPDSPIEHSRSTSPYDYALNTRLGYCIIGSSAFYVFYFFIAIQLHIAIKAICSLFSCIRHYFLRSK